MPVAERSLKLFPKSWIWEQDGHIKTQHFHTGILWSSYKYENVPMYFSIRVGNEQELRARCGDCRRWKLNQCLLTGNPLFGTVWTGLQSLLTLLVFIKPFYKAYIRLITCSQIPLSSQRENTSSASTSKETPVWSIPPKYSQRCYFHHWSLHFWQ